MRHLLLTLALVCSYTFSAAQKLSLAQLQLLCSKEDFTEVNRYLSARGWEYYDSDRSEGLEYNTITWSYGKQDWSDRASAWVKLYTYEGAPSKVSYGAFTQSWFQAIDQQVRNGGYTREEAEIRDGSLERKYAGSRFYVTLMETQRSDSEYYQTSTTGYYVIVVEKGTIYDPNNGPFELTYSNGRPQLTGELKNGELHGEIRTYYRSGGIQKVEYMREGESHGPVKHYFESGQLEMEGNMRNGKLHGEFKSYNTEGKLVAIKTFSHGINTGPHMELDQETGFRIEGNKRNGELNGMVRGYTGEEMVIEMEMVRGVPHGKQIRYDSLGRVTDEIQNVDGKQHGPFTEYHYEDSMKLTGTMQEGKIHGERRCYYRGQLVEIVHYDQGQKHGLYQEYATDSFAILKEGTYQQNQKHGTWTQYYYFEPNTPTVIRKATYQDGQLHGPYFLRRPDSVIYARYQTGQLHGSYIRYRDFTFELLGIPSLDSTNSGMMLVERGNYRHGKRYGRWEHYHFGHLRERGYYADGQPHGRVELYSPFPEDSGRITQVHHFINGELDGPFQINRSYEQKYSPCPDSVLLAPKLHPDSCIQWIQNPYYITGSYRMGMLDGAFEKRDSTRSLLEKGTYRAGKKYGSWQTRLEVDGFYLWNHLEYRMDEPHGSYLLANGRGDTMSTGQYINGHLHGRWKYYLPGTQTPYHEATYRAGQLHGTSLWRPYLSADTTYLQEYREGVVQAITIPHITPYADSSMDAKVTYTYQGTNRDFFIQPVLQTFYTGDTIFKQEYRVMSHDSVPEFRGYLLQNPLLHTDISNDLPIKVTKDGYFRAALTNGELLQTGQYFKAEKSGIWTTYHRDQGLIRIQRFEKDQLRGDRFVDALDSDLPFSGKLYLFHHNGAIHQEIKIKNGLRHGKTKIYDPMGELVEKEKYREGVLQ